MASMRRRSSLPGFNLAFGPGSGKVVAFVAPHGFNLCLRGGFRCNRATYASSRTPAPAFEELP